MIERNLMKVHCLIFEGFSDWEPSFILPELRKNSVEIVTVGFSKSPIVSMGGLHIKPDEDLRSLDPSSIKTLIIPGGLVWEEGVPDGFLELVKKLHSLKANLAAICGATLVLADAGLLDSCKHTSNDLSYLEEMSSSYEGSSHYISDQLAISDGNIITASGVGPIEFAREILLSLKIYNEAEVSMWFDLFKHAKF